MNKDTTPKYPRIMARASAEQVAKFKRLGGAEWLRRMIDEAKEAKK